MAKNELKYEKYDNKSVEMSLTQRYLSKGRAFESHS